MKSLSLALLLLGFVLSGASHDSSEAETVQMCVITVEGYHGGASEEIRFNTGDSQVRTRVGWWASLTRGGDVALHTFSPSEEFSIDFDLRLGCNSRRRYRFVFGAGSETFTHTFPSEDSFTQDQRIDLGDISRFFDWIEPGAGPASEQPVTVEEILLEGEWVRRESNHDPNDGMKISVSGNEAVLTYAPESAGSAWEPGEILWQEISADGTLEVLGSDNNYYPAQMTPVGSTVLEIDIHHNGAGNDQTWERAEGCWPDEYMAQYGQSTPGMWVRAEGLPEGFENAMYAARDADAAIQTAAVSRSGEWIVVAANKPCYSPDFPESVRSAVENFISRGREVDVVAFGPGGEWVVIAEDLMQRSGVSESAANWVRRLMGGGKRIDAFSFSAEGVVIVSDGEAYTFDFTSMPGELPEAISSTRPGQRMIHEVAFGNENWVLVAEDWYASSGLATELLMQLDRYRTAEERRINHVVLHPNGDNTAWALISNKAEPTPDSTDLINLVEHGLPGDSSIYQRMELHNVDGLSIAVIENNQIAWARGYGSRATRRNVGGTLILDFERYVYPSTIFDAASISKPVTAAAIMQLVDNDELSLTENGILFKLVQAGIIPANQLPLFMALDPLNEINLARVLSHCAGLDHMHGGSGAQEFSLDDNLPSNTQLILGLGPARANTRVIRNLTPGDTTHYSGANYAIVQALIEEYSDDGFNRHLHDLFDDLEMISSSFSPPEDLNTYARGYDLADCDGSCPIRTYGNKAAAGLTTTAMDLARFVIMLNQDGMYAGRRVLSSTAASQMIKMDDAIGSTVSEVECDRPGTMGLGIRAGSRNDDRQLFWHGGTHNGYKARMWGYPQRGVGLVILSTGASSDANNLRDEILRSFRSEYVR